MEDDQWREADQGQNTLVAVRTISRARLAVLQASTKSAEQRVAADRREDAAPAERGRWASRRRK
jgi:hypothetical protein